MTPEVEAWVRLAEFDRRLAERAAEEPDPILPGVCFHARQCLEKYLKAPLIDTGRPWSRTHDLGALVPLVVDVLPTLAAYEEDLRAMGPYAVAIRYPSSADLWKDLDDDAAQAITTMTAVREIVRAALGASPETTR